MINGHLESSISDDLECCIFGAKNKICHSRSSSEFINIEPIHGSRLYMNEIVGLERTSAKNNRSRDGSGGKTDKLTGKVKVSKISKKGNFLNHEKAIQANNNDGYRLKRSSSPNLATTCTSFSKLNQCFYQGNPSETFKKQYTQVEFQQLPLEQRGRNKPSLQCKQLKSIDSLTKIAHHRSKENIYMSPPNIKINMGNANQRNSHLFSKRIFNSPPPAPLRLYKSPSLQLQTHSSYATNNRLILSPKRPQFYLNLEQYNSLIYKLGDGGVATGVKTNTHSALSESIKQKCTSDFQKDQQASPNGSSALKESTSDSNINMNRHKSPTSINFLKIGTTQSLVRVSDSSRLKLSEPKIEQSMILIDFFNPSKNKLQNQELG